MLASGTPRVLAAIARSLEPWARARSKPRPRPKRSMPLLRPARAAALRRREAPPWRPIGVCSIPWSWSSCWAVRTPAHVDCALRDACVPSQLAALGRSRAEHATLPASTGLLGFRGRLDSGQLGVKREPVHQGAGAGPEVVLGGLEVGAEGG